jgi:hypothetical protein
VMRPKADPEAEDAPEDGPKEYEKIEIPVRLGKQ